MVDTGRTSDGNSQFIDQKRVEELSTQLTAARAQTADAEAKLRRLEEVTGGASSAYRNDLLLAKSREEEISKRLNEAIRAFEVADRDRASLRSLKAVARGARTIYDNFVQRYSETLQQNFPVIEARVISPALPPSRKAVRKP
jgi:succinoglycan biosynthesis transport protein ExoP